MSSKQSLKIYSINCTIIEIMCANLIFILLLLFGFSIQGFSVAFGIFIIEWSRCFYSDDGDSDDQLPYLFF